MCKNFMNDILNKSMVLVLNRNWQAVNVRTPQEAFCMMATNVATGLEIEFGHFVRMEMPLADDLSLVHCFRPQRVGHHVIRMKAQKKIRIEGVVADLLLFLLVQRR